MGASLAQRPHAPLEFVSTNVVDVVRECEFHEIPSRLAHVDEEFRHSFLESFVAFHIVYNRYLTLGWTHEPR